MCHTVVGVEDHGFLGSSHRRGRCRRTVCVASHLGRDLFITLNSEYLSKLRYNHEYIIVQSIFKIYLNNAIKVKRLFTWDVVVAPPISIILVAFDLYVEIHGS